MYFLRGIHEWCSKRPQIVIWEFQFFLILKFQVLLWYHVNIALIYACHIILMKYCHYLVYSEKDQLSLWLLLKTSDKSMRNGWLLSFFLSSVIFGYHQHNFLWISQSRCSSFYNLWISSSQISVNIPKQILFSSSLKTFGHDSTKWSKTNE